MPKDLLDYVSFIGEPNDKSSKKSKSSDTLRKSGSSSSIAGKSGNSTDGEEGNGGDPVDVYPGPIQLRRFHPLIGHWKGNFTFKTRKGSQTVDEEFFIYGMACEKADERLSELPSEPYTTVFRIRPAQQVQLAQRRREENGGEDGEGDGDEGDAEEAEQNEANCPESITGEIHLVGFGRNQFGRFSVYMAYDELTRSLKCEKKYVTTKYKGLKRGRKPLSSYSMDSRNGDDPNRMSTRHRYSDTQRDSFGGDAGDFDTVSTQKRKRQPVIPIEKASSSKDKDRNPLASIKFGSGLIKVKEERAQQLAEAMAEDPNYRTCSFDEETGEIYEGEVHDGQRHGKGVCLFPDGTLYEGLWQQGREHGRGVLMKPDRSVIFTGEWVEGLMHGHGSYNFANGDRYTGDWREGLRHGKGEYSWSNGCKYEGEWRDNKRHGRGLFTWSEAQYYDGDWSNDMRHGKGLLVLGNGFRYDGYWHQNFFEGKGSCIFPDNQEYQGSFRMGLREGRGSIIFQEGAIYEGRFKDDYMDGQGTIKVLNPVAGIDEDEIMIPIEVLKFLVAIDILLISLAYYFTLCVYLLFRLYLISNVSTTKLGLGTISIKRIKTSCFRRGWALFFRPPVRPPAGSTTGMPGVSSFCGDRVLFTQHISLKYIFF